jgi:hypothetical protein
MKAMMAMLAVAAAAAFSSAPAQAQYLHCVHGRGCVPATAASYNSCYTLAIQRGWSETDNRRGGGRGLDYFIYQCLAGRIPR